MFCCKESFILTITSLDVSNHIICLNSFLKLN